MITKKTLTRQSIDELAKVCPGVTVPERAMSTIYGCGDGTQSNPFTWDEYQAFLDLDYASNSRFSGVIYYKNRSGNLEVTTFIPRVDVSGNRPGGSGNEEEPENPSGIWPPTDNPSGYVDPNVGGGGSTTSTPDPKDDGEEEDKEEEDKDENEEKTEKEKFDEMIKKFFETPNDCVFKYLAYDWRYWMKGKPVGFDYENDFKKKFNYDGYMNGVNTEDVLPFLQMYYNVATFFPDKIDYSLKAAQAKGFKTMVVVRKMENGKEILHAVALEGFKDNILICIETAGLCEVVKYNLGDMVVAYSLQPKKTWMPKDN